MELRVRSDRPEDRLGDRHLPGRPGPWARHPGCALQRPAAPGPAAADARGPARPRRTAEADNPRAGYIAQRSQHGSGTARDRLRTSLPESSASLIEHSGQRGRRFAGAGVHDGASRRRPGARRPFPAVGTDGRRARESAEAAAAIPLDARPIAQIGANAAAADENLHLKGDPSPDDRLLADTRESLIAAYLDGWKRRVERVGTLNFPDEARRQAMSGNPVLEVAIGADGQLEQVLVRRTSGHRELDNAALRIVRLAAPFDPFPPAMREQYPRAALRLRVAVPGGPAGRRLGLHGRTLTRRSLSRAADRSDTCGHAGDLPDQPVPDRHARHGRPEFRADGHAGLRARRARRARHRDQPSPHDGPRRRVRTARPGRVALAGLPPARAARRTGAERPRLRTAQPRAGLGIHAAGLRPAARHDLARHPRTRWPAAAAPSTRSSRSATPAGRRDSSRTRSRAMPGSRRRWTNRCCSRSRPRIAGRRQGACSASTCCT